jgi:uncharacterized delta-60 repeat protein
MSSAARPRIFAFLTDSYAGFKSSLRLVLPTLLLFSLNTGLFAQLLDNSSDPGAQVNGTVTDIALQVDGKIVIGGTFTTVRGIARNGAARLNSDGTLDYTFSDQNFPGQVSALFLQNDGKILVARIPPLNTTTVPGLIRLNSDGSLDDSFSFHGGELNRVYSLKGQADGKVLVGGQSDGNTNYVARLNVDGTVDSSFVRAYTYPYVPAYAIGAQADGKILMGGWFTAVNGVARNYLARLNSDGSVDVGFTPGIRPVVLGIDHINVGVRSLSAQRDGKIWVGGYFTPVDRLNRVGVARFNVDGSPDSAFNPATGTNQALSILVQQDRTVLIGSSTFPLGSNSNFLARLNADGSLDKTFKQWFGMNSTVTSLALQPDGKILIGGNFVTLAGNSRARIARLNSDGTLDETFLPGVGSTNVPLPVITEQPSSNDVPRGSNVSFEVRAMGAGPFQYQWFLNGSALNGQTNHVLNLLAVGASDEGAYSVRIDNAGGAVMSAAATLAVLHPPVITAQPRSMQAFVGETVTFDIATDGTSPFTYTWRFNGNVIATTGPELILRQVQPSHAGGYSVTVSNAVGVAVSASATLTISSAPGPTVGAGDVDRAFDPGSTVNGRVSSIVMQPDGKVLIAGEFTTVRGALRNRIARLNPSGSVDREFDPGTGPDNRVSVVALQTDGKILLGGYFRTISGIARNYLARLNPDGTLDSGFNSRAVISGVISITTQPDEKLLVGERSRIYRLNSDGTLDQTFTAASWASSDSLAVAVQPDGKILIGGAFNSVNSNPRDGLARLNPDGTLDMTFDPGRFVGGVTGFPYGISSITLEASGKLIVTGSFGASGVTIARLNSDGSLDRSFVADSERFLYLQSAALQKDGKVLATGYLINGAQPNAIARLTHDGSLDLSFNPPTARDDSIACMALQTDGKILIAGRFASILSGGRILREGQKKWNEALIRLNTDGSLDSTFTAGSGPNDSVLAAAVQPDGKVVLGGHFTLGNGTNRNSIARLNIDGSLDSGFDPGAGANDAVHAIALQADGKIVLGGRFRSINDATRNQIARLNADGSLDSNFNPTAEGVPGVLSVVLQRDGKILVGGYFFQINGTRRSLIARLHADGNLDATFAADIGIQVFPYIPFVNSIVTQPDGKILIAGWFYQVGGSNRYGIARLHSNGTLDPTFNAQETFVGYNRLLLQADGKVLIGAKRLNPDGTLDTNFNSEMIMTSLALQSDGKILVEQRSSTNDTLYFKRLNPNGSVDSTFRAIEPNGSINAADLGLDGSILVAGDFTSIGGTPRAYVARMLGNSVSVSAIRVDLQSESEAVLTWWNPAFSLQSSGAVTGPYTNVPAAKSPYSNSLTTGPQLFFRLKAD